MTSCEGILTTDVSKGSVVLPWMLESPVESADLVGRILVHPLEQGDRINLDDTQELSGPEYIPFFEYIDRPGAIEKIVDLDRRTFDEMGLDFSDKPWNEDNFRMVLPGKAEVSFVVEMGDEFIGYCVGSEQVPGEVHGHRIVIEPRWRTGLLSVAIWCVHWRRTVANPNNSWLNGEVGIANWRMSRFLEKLGFHRLTAEETRDYLDRRDRKEPLEGVEIIGDGGARSIVMAMRVRESP